MCVDDDHDDHAADDVVVLDHVDAGDDHHHHGADGDDHDVDHDDDNALRFAQPGVHAAINGPARLSGVPRRAYRDRPNVARKRSTRSFAWRSAAFSAPAQSCEMPFLRSLGTMRI